MAFFLTNPDEQLPIPAASTIPPRTFVKLAGSSALAVLPVGSVNDRPFGNTQEATAARGEAAAIFLESNIVKCIAAASVGAGAEVMVASIGVASGAQRNAIATTTLLGPLVIASGTLKWAVGISMTPAAAGEVFSVYIKPRATGQVLDN